MSDPSTDDTMLAETPATSDSGGLATVVANRYRVLALVGRGGMGAVYRVRDEVLDEIVALKMLRRELLGSTDAVARFVQEVKLARKVTHPNVARTFDIGEHEADRFLTMEWIEGESLAAALARGSVGGAVVRIVTSICDGVAAAHAVDVIHRDLKPENVMLASDGRVVVTDFGIARANSTANLTEGIVGTPAYMAPEQLEGKRIDARADVYAIGEILYELLAGVRAFPGDQPFVVAAAKLRDETPDPRRHRANVPDALAVIAMRCMERDPIRRYPSVTELAAALRAVERASLPSPPIEEHPRRTSLPVTTLAVRAFANRGAAEDDEIARGLSEDVLDTLSTVPGVRVRFAPNNDLDARAIGRELGVDVVLEGTLRRDEEEARLSARVISVADGFQVWARRFAAPRAKLLRMADDAANAVAEALTAHVEAPRRAAVDPLALDSYLRGRDLIRRNWYDPRSDASVAIGLFEDALARAPNEPTFLAACAIALSRQGSWGVALERATHAVSLAPHYAEAWLALAKVHIAAGNTLAAIKPAAEAYRRGPSLAEASNFIGGLFDEIGPVEAAHHYLRRACEIDPDNNAWLGLMRTLVFLGEQEEARRLSTTGALSTTMIRYSTAGRYAMWSRDLAWLQDLQPPAADAFPLIRVLWETAVDGRPDAATRAAFAAMRAGVPDGRFARFLSQINAEIAAATGDPTVFDALREVEDRGLADVMWLDRCPLLEGLRSDPRFVAIRAVVEERARVLREALAREGIT